MRPTAAVAAVDADPASSTVAHLATNVGVSPATLRRWFTERIGISPRTYRPVARYRAFTDGFLSPGSPSTAMVAALSRYVDQSHASLDFVRFTGLTPHASVRSSTGSRRWVDGAVMSSRYQAQPVIPWL